MTVQTEEISSQTSGFVTKAFGNLVHVKFSGPVRNGEVAYVCMGDVRLKGEVIEIRGEEAKIQIFEDTREIKVKTPVAFTGELLEAELGPGLIGSIFDGLQNPLEEIANINSYYLYRGTYINAIDRHRHWNFTPKVHVGDTVYRGDSIGTVLENRFHHRIMVPFSYYGKYKITWVAKAGSYAVETPLAKAVDTDGKEVTFNMLQKWPIKIPLVEGERIKPSKMLTTGLRVLDTNFSLMKGGTFCTPGPFGAGKTVLQHHLAKYSSVDVCIMCACGERAGEVVEVLREFPHLIDPNTQESLMKRTIIICNTSSMPVAARESSIYLGITLAEYYRQMGLDVLLLADSTSRWAQAMREMSGRLEEIPGEEAFPAYLASRIAALYERAGVISLSDGSQGSVTIGGSVSPAGGNFEEPVTQATLSVVGAFLGLSRERAVSRRYPSIDPLISWSKYLPRVGKELEHEMLHWTETVKLSTQILAETDEIKKRMEVVGEEGISISDMVVMLKGELYDFCYLQQNAFDKEDSYCSLKRQIATFALIRKILIMPLSFASHDEARNFFLQLQNRIKNMNFMTFESPLYDEALKEIEATLNQRG